MDERSTAVISAILLIIGLICLAVSYTIFSMNLPTGFYVRAISQLTALGGLSLTPAGIFGFALIGIRRFIKWLIN